MKKVILVLLSCVFGFSLSALTETINSVWWTYSVANGEATVTGIPQSTGGAITIPSTLGGYSVTTIGDSAFYGCSGLTRVTIPSSVTSIGNSAFYDCSGLTSITIPSSVTTIGDSAFSDCSGLRSVTIPSSVTTIGRYAFYGCSGLTWVTIPEGVTSIGYRAFSGCRGLTSVTIPEGVTSIGGEAFFVCTRLTSVTIPSSVTSIGGGAFAGCSGLRSVTIPEGVTTIGGSAFSGCSGLTSVTIPSSVTSIGSSVFCGCSGLTSVTISEGVTSIGGGAFEGCSGLTSVTIPEGVTTIGNSAFRGCSGLTSVTIPSSVTTIDDFAFLYCSNLKISVDAQNQTYVSQDGALFNKAMTEIIRGPGATANYAIPEGVTSIGNRAFEYCSGLKSVTIPSSVTTIGDSAFYGCSNLYKDTNGVQYESANKVVLIRVPQYLTGTFEIPNTVRFIYSDAFMNCSGLTSVTIPSSVTEIGDEAFSGCSGLTSVTIPSSVTTIGDSAFEYCSGLTSVTIPEGVTSIGGGAFEYCSGLTSVTIPEGVTSIGGGAFKYCSGLMSVTIPEGVTTIGDGAFYGCSGLVSVIFKGDPPTVSTTAFPLCNGYYPLSKETAWTKANASSGIWNNLRMSSYQSVKLTFNANGGTGGSSGDYVVGMDLQAPTVSREGYTFKGWSPSVPSEVPETATTYTAQWQVNQYRMTFNANGGTGGQTLTLNYGSQITAPQVEREGYTLTGWNPSLPRTVPATNKTFVAQWKINQYTQTFNANGGEGGTSVTLDYGSALSAPIVTREGYTFIGWSPSVPMTVPATNTIYVAQWVMGCEVTINCKGDGIVSGAGFYQPGESIILTATPKDGAVFCGWAGYKKAAEETISFVMPEEDVTLNAYFANASALEAYLSAHGSVGGGADDLDSLVEAEIAKRDLHTADEMQEMVVGNPEIDVKGGVIVIRLHVKDGKTNEVMDGGEVSVEIAPKAGEKAGFYKFVVPNQQ